MRFVFSAIIFSLYISHSALAHEGDVEIKASVSLGSKAFLEVISPSSKQELARSVTDSIRETQEQFELLLGEEIPVKASLHLLSEDVFFRVTRAPKWTNALFVGGKILIPISEKGLNVENLERSARHEFVHAITNYLSNSRVRGYLDEGIAQWAEGAPLPILNTILKKWMQKNDPIPLALLQGGFTRLDTKMVGAAYAQSLFATTMLIEKNGFNSFGKYFKELKNGKSHEVSFESAFGLTEAQFEYELALDLRAWARAN